MKRLQLLVPDDVYQRLTREAQRREPTISDLARLSIDRQLESSVDGFCDGPPLTVDMGEVLLPPDRWWEAAN
jgi:hypothetical protein